MKPRTLLILTLLTLGMAAFIFFLERDLPSTDEQRELEKKVVPLEADEVIELTLRWGENELRFEKEAPAEQAEDALLANRAASSAGWRLAAPIAARADSAAVLGLISQLVGLEKGRTIEHFDAEQLGLLEPRASAVLKTKKSERTIKIGAELPLSADLIAQGDETALAYQIANAGTLVEDMTRAVADWRDKRLIAAERAEIESITLIRGAERLLLVRRGDAESFWLEGELSDRADSQDIGGLLSTLLGLQATTFLDIAPTGVDLGLEPAAQAIEVMLKGQDKPWRLDLGHAVEALTIDSGERFARVQDQLIQLAAQGLEEPLAKTAAEWRSRAWSSIQVFKVDHANFDLDGQKVEIRRDSGDWLRVNEGADSGDREDVKIDYTAASDALYPLTEVRAVELLEPAAAAAAGHALTDPVLEIMLIASDGGEETLSLFATQGQTAAATIAGREAVLLLSAEDAQGVLEKVRALRDAEPLAEDDEDDEEAS